MTIMERMIEYQRLKECNPTVWCSSQEREWNSYQYFVRCFEGKTFYL